MNYFLPDYNMIKVIFIDVDNTLLDFDEFVRQAMKSGFSYYKLKAYENWMYEIFTEENTKLWKQIELGSLSLPELEQIRWNHIFRKIGIDFDGVVFEKYFRDTLYESVIPVAGAYSMLDALKGNYLLCVASNGPYDQQMHRLKLANMEHYFDYFFISEKIRAAKPAAAFFDYAFSKLNENRSEIIRPENCMIIGDSMTSDMKGGFDYGMKTCYFRRRKSDVIDPKIDIVVDDLSEVIRFFDCDHPKNRIHSIQ